MRRLISEQKEPDVSVSDGKIVIDGHKYQLKTWIDYELPIIKKHKTWWQKVDVKKLTPSKSSKNWSITAGALGTEKTSEVDPEGIEKIIKQLGNKEIDLTDKKGTKYKLVKEDKMSKIVKLSEADLTNIIKKVLQEQDQSNYMFFSNLEQIKRQCEMMLEMDPDTIDKIIQNGHDWADDHISEAKTNIDQVFDFFKNKMSEESDYLDYEDINEGRKKTGTKLCARGKSAAKSKFKVYPSAYANGYAVQVCKGDIAGLDGKKHCSGSYC